MSITNYIPKACCNAIYCAFGYDTNPKAFIKNYQFDLLNFVGYFPVLSMVGGTVRVIYAIVKDGVTYHTATQMLRGIIEISGFGSALIVPDMVATGWRAHEHWTQYLSNKMMQQIP